MLLGDLSRVNVQFYFTLQILPRFKHFYLSYLLVQMLLNKYFQSNEILKFLWLVNKKILSSLTVLLLALSNFLLLVIACPSNGYAIYRK